MSLPLEDLRSISIQMISEHPSARFHHFSAYVGGSSTNIAVGCARLGLRTALLTAIGPDKVGEFILHFLHKEGVITDYIPVIEKARSSAVLLGYRTSRPLSLSLLSK